MSNEKGIGYKVSLDSAQMVAAIGAVRSHLGELGKKFLEIGSLIGISFAGFKGIEGFAGEFKGVAEAGRSLQTMHVITGETVRDLVVLQKAFEEAGIDAGGVQGALSKLQKAMGGVNEDGVPTGAVFARIGLNLQQLKGETAVQQFQQISEALAKLRTQADKTAAIREMFGRSGEEMMAVLANPQALAEAAQSAGGVAAIYQRNAEIFTQVAKAFEEIRYRMKNFWTGIAEGIAPAVLPLLNKIQSIDFVKWGEEIGSAIGELRSSLLPLFDWMGTKMAQIRTVAVEWAGKIAEAARITVALFQSGNLGQAVSLSLKIGFAEAVNFFADALKGTIIGLAVMLKTAFADSWKFITDPKAQEGMKMLFSGLAMQISAAISKGIIEGLAAVHLIKKDVAAVELGTQEVRAKTGQSEVEIGSEEMGGAFDKSFSGFMGKLLDAANAFKVQLGNSPVIDQSKIDAWKKALGDLVDSAKATTDKFKDFAEVREELRGLRHDRDATKLGSPDNAGGVSIGTGFNPGILTDTMARIGAFVGRGGPAGDAHARDIAANTKTSADHLKAIVTILSAGGLKTGHVQGASF